VRQTKENKNSPSWTTTKRKTHRPKQKNQNKNLQFGLEANDPLTSSLGKTPAGDEPCDIFLPSGEYKVFPLEKHLP
jgi:hypothetical protein